MYGGSGMCPCASMARRTRSAARGTFDRILGKPPQAVTGDADNPLSIVIEEVALRVAGNGDGASA